MTPLFKALSGGRNNEFIGRLVGYLQNNKLFRSVIRRELLLPIGDETTAITVGTNKFRFRAPCDMKVLALRGSLNVGSTGGPLTVDVNSDGTTIMATSKVNFDATELTTDTAATPNAITAPTILKDSIVSVDVDAVGTGAAGLKLWLIYEEIY